MTVRNNSISSDKVIPKEVLQKIDLAKEEIDEQFSLYAETLLNDKVHIKSHSQTRFLDIYLSKMRQLRLKLNPRYYIEKTKKIQHRFSKIFLTQETTIKLKGLKVGESKIVQMNCTCVDKGYCTEILAIKMNNAFKYSCTSCGNKSIELNSYLDDYYKC